MIHHLCQLIHFLFCILFCITLLLCINLFSKTLCEFTYIARSQANLWPGAWNGTEADVVRRWGWPVVNKWLPV